MFLLFISGKHLQGKHLYRSREKHSLGALIDLSTNFIIVFAISIQGDNEDENLISVKKKKSVWKEKLPYIY